MGRRGCGSLTRCGGAAWRTSSPMLVLLALLAFGAQANALRVAVIVHGESFRANAKQNSREVGVAGYDTVDFNVLTYRTGFEQDLVRWYGPTANVTFTDKPEGGAAHLQPAGTRDLVVSVLNSATPYDAVFLTRIDVWFKPAFVAALLAADLSKIVFPFMCGPEMGGCAEELQKPPGSGSCPRISDMFVWIPRAYFSYVLLDQHKFLNNHHTYQTIETLVPGGVEALSTVLRYEMVDSDPMKERNRIYRLAGRVQKKEWGSYMWRNQTAVGTDTFRTSSLHSLLTNEDDSVDPTQRPVPPAVCTRRVQIC